MPNEDDVTREYTAYQQQAIAADGQDICVSAGAGSGKTGVLVERFVRIVTQSKDGLLPPARQSEVDGILVITFTEKATKEMKTRLVAELARLGLLAERRQIETAYISTIHGFCSRLLQENPFEAGIDPQFSVLDAPQAKRLLRQTCEEVIAAAYEANDTEITELTAAVQSARPFGDVAGDPIVVLSSAVEMTLNALRGAGRSLPDLERHWRLGLDASAAQSLEPVWALLTPLLSEITACAAALETVQAGLTGALDLACHSLREQLPRLRPRACEIQETLVALEETLKAAGKARPRPVNAPPQEIELAQMLHRIRAACEEAKSLFGVVAAREEQAALTCHRLLGLTCRVWKAFESAKRRRGQLDNDDLQAEGVLLLEQSASVRRRYRSRFRHIMVDEFQDTNPLQMRLIDLLHHPDSDTSGANAPNSLFIVGDVQQSIYGFRYADSTLFRDLERRFREEGAGLHVPLSVNFRSRPEILSAVEQVFKQAWRQEMTPFVPLTPGTAFDPKPTPSLEILLTQDIARKDYVRLEAEALAARIQHLVESREICLTSRQDRRRGEPVAYRDIAVLLRGLTDIRKYEEAFARRGVPYFVVGGGRGYYARHEIRDLLNVLTVLDTPLDDVALAAVLRSPLVGADVDTLARLSRQAGTLAASSASGGGSRTPPSGPLYPALHALIDSGELPSEESAKLRGFVEVIEALRVQEDRLPVGHLLERLIAQTHYDARLLCRPGGRRRLANVRKLLQMANADSVLGVREFIRRLRDLEKLTDREGDAPTEEEAADVVRFLTIHGAKGLEFPVVILADLSRGLLRPESGLFVCDPQHTALGTRLDGEPNVVYKAIARRREEADKKESERLLYVAMTRAREHLVLCGNLGRNRSFNWADDLFRTLGILEAPPEPGVQTLLGGLSARVAPLSYYVHTPLAALPDSQTAARRESERHADEITDAILHGQSLNTLL